MRHIDCIAITSRYGENPPNATYYKRQRPSLLKPMLNIGYHIESAPRDTDN